MPLDRLMQMLNPRTEPEHTAVKRLSEWPSEDATALLDMIRRAGLDGDSDPTCTRCLSTPAPLIFAGRLASGELSFVCTDCATDGDP